MDKNTLSELCNNLASIFKSIDWQSIVNFSTAIILFLTFRAQLQANKINRWAKRAENLPNVKMNIEIIYPTEDNGSGGTRQIITGECSLNLKLSITNNSITELDYEINNIVGNHIINSNKQTNKKAFYTDGSEITFHNIISFTPTDSFKLNNKGIFDSPSATIDIFYSDLIGNEYTQSLVYCHTELTKTTEMIQTGQTKIY